MGVPKYAALLPLLSFMSIVNIRKYAHKTNTSPKNQKGTVSKGKRLPTIMEFFEDMLSRSLKEGQSYKMGP